MLSWSMRWNGVRFAHLKYTRVSKVVIVLPSQQGTYGLIPIIDIYSATDLGGHGRLEVIVEKDFACLDPSDADNHDTFLNQDSEERKSLWPGYSSFRVLR
jgi:hypothetical protein